MNRWNVEICDVTLRDGEQTPGVTFTCEEKMEIAGMLDGTGIEVIEAGFPAVSASEKAAVRAICEMGLDARICALSRAKQEDIDAALDCGVDMIGVFMPTSDLHISLKYGRPREEVLARTMEMVAYAHDHGVQVRFGAEDASRSDPGFLFESYRQAVAHGADLVTFADTVGCMTPIEMVAVVQEYAPSVGVPLCIHCHDDMGCATANTVTAAASGAFQLHTTVNGIGERAGNAALEEVLVLLALKGGINRYDLSGLHALSELVTQASGLSIARNKAIVGDHAFAHESGIHIAAILRDPEAYEYVRPALVGCDRTFILGKHTGRHAVRHVASSLGYDLEEDEITWVLHQVKARSEAKCAVTPEVLQEILCKAICADRTGGGA
ncbi:homocitrate synthase/isopropylmalate synthase family protein [Methanofollis fontis]|uniref:Homoaconitate hydratase n=1 Tax=Methanofollis fontis TaxID=2052832 RepID=A0A483CUD6_9EURY|nr:homoaconitate hydratase [Methanofollis fontis]TAJ45206.1 homoaconitate hydratase [Methanofollis fontis]